MKLRTKKCVLAHSVALAVGATSFATVSGAQAQGGDGQLRIEEVLVTAQRREEDLQSVPLSVTALDQTVLEYNNATSLNDIMYLAPSVYFGETGFGQNAILLNIRGHGTFGGRSPSVSLYYNEVPMMQVGFQAPGAYVGGRGMFYDLENVQVLKGPQGTLFGRNSVGGAVLMQTRRPGKEAGGHLEVGVGNYDNVEVRGAADIPLAKDKLLMRVAYSQQKRNGYVDVHSAVYEDFPVNWPDNPPGDPDGYDSHDTDNRHWRATLTWMPTDTIRNDLIVGQYRDRTHGQQLILDFLLDRSNSDLPDFIGITPVAAFFPFAEDVVAEQNALGKKDVAGSSTKDNFDTDLLTVANQTSIDLTEGLTLRNIFGYMEQELDISRDFDGSELILFARYRDGDPVKRKQYSEEIQLLGTSFEDKLEWQVGVFYHDLPDQGYERRSQVAFYGAPVQVDADWSEESISYYAQGTYSLTEQFSLTLGYRHSTEKAKAWTRQLANYECTPAFQGNPFDENCEAVLDDKWNVDTWNVTLEYQITDDVMVYGAARRGFRAGGFNQTTITDADILSYDEEELDAFELGLKADWALGSMPVRTNLALFSDKAKGPQATINLGTEGNLLLGITNAPDADIEGAELEVTAQPTENFTFMATASYLKVEYDIPDYFTPTDIFDLAGTELYGRPEYSYTLSGNYRVPLGDAGELNFYANYAWVDDTATNKFHNNTYLDKHGILNLNIDWQDFMGEPLDVSFFMTNALDKTYRSYVIAEGSLGYASYGYGPPRMWGVNLTYRFGAES